MTNNLMPADEPNLNNALANLSPQTLAALNGAGLLQNLNPIDEIQTAIDEPRGSLIPMMVGGLIERKKTRTQRRNIAEKRLLIEERTAALSAALAQVKAVDQLAEAMLSSGGTNELQRMVLSLTYPQAAKRVKQREELADLKHQVAMARENADLFKYRQLVERHDPREAYQNKLDQQREETLLAIQHAMTTAAGTLNLARQLRTQIRSGNFTVEEQALLEQKLDDLLAQTHLDAHGDPA